MVALVALRSRFLPLPSTGPLLAGAVWLASCSCSQQETPPTAAPAEASAAPAQTSGAARARGAPSGLKLLADEPYDSQEFGALHGTILFEGEAPERKLLGAAQMPECTHHPEVDQRGNVIVVNDGKLAGAFVTLTSGYDKKKIPPAPATPVTLDQRGCMYVPRVLALRLGQKLLVANSDPTTHNVHARAKKNDELNVSRGETGPQQQPIEIPLRFVEQPIRLNCDIHPWMGAAVFVEEHPWFAITDEQGAFTIRDVPPGEYDVAVKHEILDGARGRVKVEAGKSTGFTLALKR